MLHFTIYTENNKYFIGQIYKNNKKNIQPVKIEYLKAMFNSFYYFGRNKRLGKKIELLVEDNIPFDFSEYDLLLMINVLYVHKYNMASGKFLIDYYRAVCPDEANEELKKILGEK